MSTVYFDESGNTGQNLLDPDQPVFVSASVCFKDSAALDEARSLASSLGSRELHFTNLKRRPSGRDFIQRILTSSSISPVTAKTQIVHKEFLVVTKMVDLLIEPLAHADGLDLYDGRANLAIANLLFLTGPHLSDTESWKEMNSAFVNMIRKRTPEAFYRFSLATWTAYETTELSYREMLAPIVASLDNLSQEVKSWWQTELDPAILSFIHLCGKWHDTLGTEFEVVHDQSKPLTHDVEFLEAIMDPEATETRVGLYGRTMPLFVRSRGLRFVDSQECFEVQLADLIASATAAYLRNGLSKYIDEDLKFLQECDLQRFSVGIIWPSSNDITPDISRDTEPPGEPMETLGAEIHKRVYWDERGRPRHRKD